MTYVWVMRVAGALCIGAAMTFVFFEPAGRSWSSVAFYVLLFGGMALVALTNPRVLQERARRQVVRAEILRELEIRDGVRQPD